MRSKTIKTTMTMVMKMSIKKQWGGVEGLWVEEEDYRAGSSVLDETEVMKTMYWVETDGLSLS